ncbi:hypothetical protein [Desertihabitans aurantiacus]|uniref:hypothetical protein n=1 Tax=Desertihabitans aurantiacus TaxID=2282477 RepID=UPI00130036F1|nr:hypothetical protein [Desertihabitans aurantiacus]
MTLHEITLQVVPVLVIALFLDTRTTSRATAGPPRRARAQHRVYLALSVSAVCSRCASWPASSARDNSPRRS